MYASISNKLWTAAYHDLLGSLIPILFIHGLGCCGSMDYPTVASGSIQAHRRIIPDLLGSGFSDYSDDFPYTIESHASLLKSFVERPTVRGIGYLRT